MKGKGRYDIAKLIITYLQRELTSGEEQMLNAWLEESPANRELFEQMKDAEHREQEIERMYSRNLSEAWIKVQSKAKQRRWKQRIRHIESIAAILAIILGSVWFFRLQPTEERILPKTTEIIPGRAMARLTVANGESYELDSITVNVPDAIVRQGKEIVFKGNSSATTSTSTVRYHKLEIPQGGEYRIVLEDGTAIYLNSETELRFPETFTATKERIVYLSGEAFFDVAKDKDRPFIVKCGEYDVKVLGTSFNISNYTDNSYSHTTLKEGAVEIIHQQEKKVLRPGQQARLQEGKMDIRKVNVENYTTWMNANFRFESENMEEILKRLSRWYVVEVFYATPEVKDYHFTGYLPRYSNIQEVLGLLEMTTDIRFDIKDKTIVVMKK